MRLLRFLPFLFILPAASVPLSELQQPEAGRANVGGAGSPQLAQKRQASELKRLFYDLRHAETIDEASKAEAEIYIRLTVSTSATTNVLLESAAVAMENEDDAGARAILDDVVRLDPQFPEGLTRAASLAYQDGDLDRAKLLLKRAIKIEPRHFGAWAGLAAVLEDSGELEAAADAYREALYLHPFLDGAKRGLTRIEAKTTGLSL